MRRHALAACLATSTFFVTGSALGAMSALASGGAPEHGRDEAAVVLAGGPPPWAPAHGYRDKHRHKGAHERIAGTPELGIERGFCNRELIGGILGGVAGGALGAQVGRGDGRTVLTIGGTIAGVLIGGRIGRRMDEADQACVGQTLERAPAHQAVAWSAPAGERYRIVPEAVYEDDWGRTCRDYQTTATIGGRQQMMKGTACRRTDGAWQRVS
jgi:surface antigen